MASTSPRFRRRNTVDDTSSQPARSRGIYLLPNLFTTATLFGGFFAIVASFSGNFEAAAIAIFASMVTDSLDGRVARLTNTQSDFGKEYDSLSDMVAFGVAASVVAYAWALQDLSSYPWLGGKLGWLGAFVYVASVALRLARFNVFSMQSGESGFFLGLPSPSGAAVVVGFVWACSDFGLSGVTMAIPMLFITVLSAVLMISNFRYPSFKDLSLKERVPFRYIVLMVLGFVLIAIDPPRVLFLGFFGYALSGPVVWLWQKRRKSHETE